MTVGYRSAEELAKALRRAAEAHGRYEERIGRADPDWPDWYAQYMAREQRYGQLPERVDPSGTTTSAQTARPQDEDELRPRDFLHHYGAAGLDWDPSDA
ncbi:hypothetical protein [Actinokineospora enzanensis]|uniref:hypothetical protein n=1 Tax=Actinokineospora enzanensis TaxID=155975 RepID=UPI00037AC911|nr:hypothetical protein [Actinokineospora enzanensis]